PTAESSSASPCWPSVNVLASSAPGRLPGYQALCRGGGNSDTIAGATGDMGQSNDDQTVHSNRGEEEAPSQGEPPSHQPPVSDWRKSRPEAAASPATPFVPTEHSGSRSPLSSGAFAETDRFV